MAWYHKLMGISTANIDSVDIEEKANPSQHHNDQGRKGSNEPSFSYELSYETIEVVNRAVNMLVDDAAEIPCRVGQNLDLLNSVKGARQKQVQKLLNYQPNPFQDINTFKRNALIDLIVDGNMFLYFDGSHLYHLPAKHVTIHTDSRTYISKYTFKETESYLPSEIIHVKENSFNSIYRGTSRLRPALNTMKLMRSMKRFQATFFSNGAVPGLVIRTPNTLSERIKDRLVQRWKERYNPESGGHNPLILDGGLEVDSLSKVNFKELDFEASIANKEETILKALGIPPILLNSGNNANIRPNLRLYYLQAVLPLVKKLNFAVQDFFGFEVTEDLTNIPALQPELRDQAMYYTSLVNGGILTANEAREKLGYKAIEGNDDVRIPANIAGSASDPSEGGRPTGDSTND